MATAAPRWRRAAYRAKVIAWRVLHRPEGRSVADVLRAEARRLRRRRPASAANRARAVNPVWLMGLQSARRALDAGDADEAMATLLEMEASAGQDPSYWRLRRQVHVRRGEMTAALVASQVAPSGNEGTRRDGLVGKLLETDPAWTPAFSHRVRPVTDPVPRRVLNVLKESVPLRENGFTMRSHGNLQALRDHGGWEPVVVTALGFPRSHVGDEPFSAVEVVDGIEHHRLDLGPGYDLKGPVQDYLRDWAWLTARKTRELRPQLIHAGSGHRGFDAALVGREVARSAGLPWVYEVRSFFESTWTPDWQNAVDTEYFQRRRDTETRCMADADAVITICYSMRDDIVGRGIDPRKVFVVPNGVDVDEFCPAPRDEALAREVGTAGHPTFGYVSNLDHPREAQELLVEALAELPRHGVHDARCLLVGKGPRSELVLERARELGVQDQVLLTGAVPHEKVVDYYRLFDVFVVPRVDEWAARYVTPLKPFEAMGVEVPLLVSALPALQEIVEEPSRGRTFAVADPQDLAARLAEMLLAPQDQRPAVERARTWVQEHRRWSHNGPRITAAYDYVLSGGPDATEVAEDA